MSAHKARADSIINYAKRSGELRKTDDSDLSARLALAFECGILASYIRELCEQNDRLLRDVEHYKHLFVEIQRDEDDEPDAFLNQNCSLSEYAHSKGG